MFENPLSVSIGSKPDILRLEFVDTRLFASLESGLQLVEGKYAFIELPKQYTDQVEYETVQILSENVVDVAESAFWASLVIALLIRTSLKTVWNIMNVM